MKIFIFIFAFIIESCVSQSWNQIPGAAVEISAKGNELWVCNQAQQIFRWSGSGWQLKPGAATRVAACSDGWTWAVNSGDKVFRWNVVINDWDLMPGLLVQISAVSRDRGTHSRMIN